MNIKAQPFDFVLPAKGLALIVIDMQRNFLEEGGFGAALGNHVTRLRAIAPAVCRTIEAFRGFGLPVIHTREGRKPDLSDCPPSKRADRYAGGERPRVRVPSPGGLHRELFPGVQASGHRHGPRPGPHRRLDHDLAGVDPRLGGTTCRQTVAFCLP